MLTRSQRRVIEAAGGKPVPTAPALVELLGAGTTILLFQLLFWHDQVSAETFYRTDKQLRKETGLTLKALVRSRQTLVELDWITVHRSGLPARLRYTVHVDNIVRDLENGCLQHRTKALRRPQKSPRSPSVHPPEIIDHQATATTPAPSGQSDVQPGLPSQASAQKTPLLGKDSKQLQHYDCQTEITSYPEVEQLDIPNGNNQLSQKGITSHPEVATLTPDKKGEVCERESKQQDALGVQMGNTSYSEMGKLDIPKRNNLFSHKGTTSYPKKEQQNNNRDLSIDDVNVDVDIDINVNNNSLDKSEGTRSYNIKLNTVTEARKKNSSVYIVTPSSSKRELSSKSSEEGTAPEEDQKLSPNPKEEPPEPEPPPELPAKSSGPGRGTRKCTGPRTPPPCPHEKIIQLYHEILPELPRVKVWNDYRRKLLQARWREDPERQNLQWWREFFQLVKRCPFLLGKIQTRDGNTFKADLEWLLRPRNFPKVVEGRYLIDTSTRSISPRTLRNLITLQRLLEKEEPHDDGS